MSDNSVRPYIRARLTNSADAWHALDVLAAWRQARLMSKHLPRAIRLYAALLQRDLSLLDEYFPYLADALGNTGGGVRRSKATKYEAPKVEYVEKSEDDDAADLFDSLGF